MKIVLDMNIPELWENFLTHAGYEAVHWSRIGDIRADDTEIMAWACKHGYIDATELVHRKLNLSAFFVGCR